MIPTLNEQVSGNGMRDDRSIFQPIVTAPSLETFHRILVATDCSPASEGALRLADLIAQRDELAVVVLSVLDPESRIPMVGALVEEVERCFATIRGQVRLVVGPRPAWHAAIDLGPVGETIARVATARASDLIVVGFGQHRRYRDRTPDKATVRQIAELASAPVLIVPSQSSVIPTRMMLALDFSRSSIEAGRAALRMMGMTHGEVHLVYIHSTFERFPAAPADPAPSWTAGFDTFFEAVEHGLNAPPGISFERAVVPHGDPVSELLAYASGNGIELIAVGNHGQEARDRPHLGSVSAGVLRSAQCMVLVSGAGRMAGSNEASIDAVTTDVTLRGGR
jgi:nucleotide-binding universal stress UspA family protein